MCGIAGITGDNLALGQEALKSMLSMLRHRGPDDFGFYNDGRAAMGHTRLSIIDLDGGRQPMSNEDGSVWISFNGEIFNYIELRDELSRRGHRFSTNSDTEVIIHLYEELGDRCVLRLNGQFAFAIWDKNRSELFIARDRLGIRPLFYCSHAGRFYFASEIKALFAGGPVPREIDPAALNEIFTLWCSVPPKTAFKGIKELPPAHWMKVKDGAIASIERYWDVPLGEEPLDIGIEAAAEGLYDILSDATRLQLRADVPVGAYLSGGLDSSITAALITKMSGARPHTFSVAFEDGAYDESRYQHEMARSLGTEHHEIRCSYSDISGVFPEVVWCAEKPVLRTAPAPLFILSRLVRETGLKVVLTGEGADEAAGGYDIFKETKIREFWAREPESRLRPLLLKKLYPYLSAFQGQSDAYREAFFNGGLSDVSDPFFSHRPRWQTTSRLKAFFSKDLLAGGPVKSPEERLNILMPQGFESWMALARAQYIETASLLPGYILSSQGDRVLMGNSVEGRYPFLDHRVVEYCARLPLRHKMRGLDEKHVLKRMARDMLPVSILKRTKQPYLAPDSKSFFAGGKVPDYVLELLSEGSLKDSGYFDPKSVGLLVKKCRRGAVSGFRDNMALVGILSTQLLHNMFVTGFEGRAAAGRDAGLTTPAPTAL
ncbi:MAG: asparagine synthase (glutamine-hydrolyzing) [Candidatus Methylomirabilis sp.]|nr:asparagine synthase (glutamine-hydrolyzing) [Deltaproteobacteria bacterium]